MRLESFGEDDGWGEKVTSRESDEEEKESDEVIVKIRMVEEGVLN